VLQNVWQITMCILPMQRAQHMQCTSDANSSATPEQAVLLHQQLATFKQQQLTKLPCPTYLLPGACAAAAAHASHAHSSRWYASNSCNESRMQRTRHTRSHTTASQSILQV
jgi:hypothetical protein